MLNIVNVFIVLTIICIFGGVSIQGYDKQGAAIVFFDRAEICKKEVGASGSDVKDLVDLKSPTTNEGKLLRFCVMRKCDVIDEYGKFNKVMAMDHVKYTTQEDEDKIKIATEIIDRCSIIEVDDNDKCEAAVQYGNCFREEVKAHKAAEYMYVFC